LKELWEETWLQIMLTGMWSSQRRYGLHKKIVFMNQLLCSRFVEVC
jgi:hypothetical protein